MDNDKNVVGHLRTDSSLIVQNWKPPERDSERSEESIVVFICGICHRNRKMRKLFSLFRKNY